MTSILIALALLIPLPPGTIKKPIKPPIVLRP